MARRTLAALVAIVAIGVLVVGPAGAAAPVATYEVTIDNLTEGQPFTPPIVATHRAATDIFTVGRPATFELKEIAENGNLGPMITALGSNQHVFETKVSMAGPLLADSSLLLTVTAAKGANFLSFASMLICTNDGFTGVDSLRLPDDIGEQVSVSTNAYDAGTEINTEDYADIVPPCQLLHGIDPPVGGTGMSNPTLAEGGVIHHHPGIDGSLADLTRATHGWANPVAEVTVERIS